MVNPKGDRTDSMLMASGAPTQHAVTNTDSGGKNGRIALHIWGRNLNTKLCTTCQKFLKYIVSKEIISELAYHLFKSKPATIGVTTICRMLETIPFTSTGNLFPMSRSDKNGVTNTAVAVDNDVMTMLRGAICGIGQ